MGQTIQNLAKRQIGYKSIFSNRFVVEICEKVHTHYRNIRIVQSLDNFITMAEGFASSLERWKKRGCPGTGSRHIELCRKNVAVADFSDTVEVNLNKNLYVENEGGIFAEGADFKEANYIHIKLRDIRLEMSIEEFKIISEVFDEASKRLESSDIYEPLSQAGIHAEVHSGT